MNGKTYIVKMIHSKNSLFPSIADMKDGIIRMMLFVNLAETEIANRAVKHFPVLGLTSPKFKGFCHNIMSEREIKSCLAKNDLSLQQQKAILSVFNEGKLNNFLVFLMDSNNPSYQDEILDCI